MSSPLRRAGFAGVAVLAVAVNAAGVGLALTKGDALAGWPLTCLGVGVPAAALGLLITWHRPANRVAWLFLGAGLGFGLNQLGLSLLADASSPAWLVRTTYSFLLVLPGPLTATWTLLILLFPEGRFLSAAWRRAGAAAVTVGFAAAALEALTAPAGYLPQQYGRDAPSWLAGPNPALLPPHAAQLLDLPGLLLPALAVVGLAWRYRRAPALERQQIKWVALAAAVVVATGALFVALGPLGVREPWFVSLALAPLPCLAATLAIFRYRLWEIDRLLSRTLAFAVLWTAAAGVFVGVAAVAGIAVGGLDDRVVAAVILSLLVAVVLHPLRGRLEERIARLIYGPRPRGYPALGRLADVRPGTLLAREVADLVAEVAQDALGARWSSVWLRMSVDGRSLLRAAGSAGQVGAAPLLLEVAADESETLSDVLPERPARVVQLIAAGDAIGLLACGGSASREFGGGDDEVLALIAQQAAVLLRSAQLEAELRERVEELRDSRQRLVAAQDAERRRLERDLHDGFQQQLLTLAVRLKGLARHGAGQADLEAVAEEAEEVVFAMQDLARGIYPGVLVDQGLVAALRSHSARLSIDVRLDIDPELAEARFAPEVEACLYFVALEGLTNVQKHAATATAAVSLRRDNAEGALVLEIHDAGAGFDAAIRGAGSGLQNMRDRLAALDGELAVRSRPGAGTWVAARLPVPAEVVELQVPGSGSRR